MLKIEASILNREKRKYWYIRYQVFYDNDSVKKKEVSTKVLKTEKSLEYMKENYLPAWISRKEDELSSERNHSSKFNYYASLYENEYKKIYRDSDNMMGRLRRILSEFGDREIATIRKLEIKLWINNTVHHQTGEDLTKATRKKYKSVFNAIFELALDDEMIIRNFVDEIKVEGKASSRNATKPFTTEEVHLLLEVSRDPKYGELLYPYLGLSFNQGLSPSEAIGLQVGDIKYNTSLEKTIMTIQRGVTKKKVGETKNEYRYRKIVLRDESKEYIDRLFTLAKERNSIWLFSKADGTRLDDIENIRGIRLYLNKETGTTEHSSSKWYKLLEDCNIDYRPIKNCRHTFTMAVLDAQIYSIPELADMLGHNSMQMINNHYGKSINGKALGIKSDVLLFNGDTLSDTNKNSQVDKKSKID